MVNKLFTSNFWTIVRVKLDSLLFFSSKADPTKLIRVSHTDEILMHLKFIKAGYETEDDFRYWLQSKGLSKWDFDLKLSEPVIGDYEKKIESALSEIVLDKRETVSKTVRATKDCLYSSQPSYREREVSSPIIDKLIVEVETMQDDTASLSESEIARAYVLEEEEAEQEYIASCKYSDIDIFDMLP